MLFFWLFMLLMDLLIPLTMVYFGRRFLKEPPDRINPAYGYRTAMSMKNMDTWRFAHEYCGRLWYRLGLILLPLSAIALLFVMGRDTERIAAVGLAVCAVQILPLAGALIPTEAALRRHFDKNGKRRS